MSWPAFAFWLLVPPLAYLTFCCLVGTWLYHRERRHELK